MISLIQMWMNMQVVVSVVVLAEGKTAPAELTSVLS